jgi:adenosine kinase
MRVLVTGSLAFDFIMDFPGKFSDHILPEKIHEINLSFLVKTLKRQNGGTAGNIAYNLALLGIKPTILATAGYDFVNYQKVLEKVGVDVSMIRIIETEPTASAFIFTDMVDNQITGFYPGAMKYAMRLFLINQRAEVGRQNFLGIKPLVKGKNYQAGELAMNSSKILQPPRAPIFVVISPNDPVAMINFVKECQKLGIDYMFDPGMQLPRLSDKDLRLGVDGAKIVIGNDYEISLITKRLENKKTKKHPRADQQIWITTLGEKGSIISLYSPNSLHLPSSLLIPISPAKPDAVLDPTGAGDAYRAGFLAGFFRGFPLEVCGRMGSVCAIYTVEKYGTTTHKFTRKEFCQRYQENFGQKLSVENG